jgi:hypothetical protein
MLEAEAFDEGQLGHSGIIAQTRRPGEIRTQIR